MCQKLEVATVLSKLGNAVEQQGLTVHQLKTLRAVKDCRTAVLGGHVDGCTDCGTIRISYNSCRNRHCPKCQGHKRHEWIAARETELLPVPYFHVVFTLPSELNKLCMHQSKLAYDCLFEASWQTLRQFFTTIGLQGGMISILHTWGQNLSLHPHLHCVVPGGGIAANNLFKKVTGKGKYLFCVKALSKVFRAKYAAALRKKGITDQVLLERLFKKNWVVYAKRAFGSATSVIEYLGRYTHKVAITNGRIKSVDKDHVLFAYKDYKDNNKQKQMRLTNQEFVRRFALHVLPKGFVRIRHYGILSSTWKRKKLKDLQERLKVVPLQTTAATKLHKCPHCKTGTMVTIETFGIRGPPAKYVVASTFGIEKEQATNN